ncbi:MAG: phosphate signaling complex protein PhoU [Oscillospiraceae bacterium]|nr:phosphate signaling complex protein PhoU [Oscillospiraceae bacterium]
MRNTFQRELRELHNELIKMGTLCENAISAAIKGLLTQDEELVRKVFQTDSEIDKKERDVEKMSLHLLLTQQPVASDLRMTSAALKMVSDMERIGDQASDIAEITRQLLEKELPKTCIPEMGDAAITMVTESIDAFVHNDLDLARKVMRDDDALDELFVDFQHRIVELMKENAEEGTTYVDLLMIAKYLERIGDHATNIAEWVEYSLTGLYKGDRL